MTRSGRRSPPRATSDRIQARSAAGGARAARGALLLLPLLIAACDGSESTTFNPPTTASSTGTSMGGGGSGAAGGEGGGDAGSGGGGDAGSGGGGSPLCGNGAIDPGEACDGDAVGDASCEALGYPGGKIGCTSGCEIDVADCAGSDDCTDGVDNDGDGLLDCDEPDCQAACADACAAAPALIDPDDTAGSTFGHADSVQSSCGGDSGGDVVYAVTASTTGLLDAVLIEDGSGSFSLSARSGCASAASELACTDAFATSFDLSKKISVPVTAGQLVFIVVDTAGAGSEGSYTLAVQSHAIECGDGLQDPPEACDDGNTDAGDGCSAACELETIEPEPNDALATATPYAAPYVASIDPEGDVDLVQVTLPASGGLVVTLGGLGELACADGTMDSVVTLLDATGAPIALNDDAGGGSLCSTLAVAGLPAGDYFVKIEAAPMAPPAAATFPYTLAIEASVCGDGAVSPGEECDDGGAAPGDGCSAACSFEVDETEQNGTLATADVYTSPWIARIDPDGDVDVVSVTVPGPTSKILAKTFGPDGGLCWPGADTYVEILSADGTVLQSSDDAGSYCSFATLPGLAAGTYFVRVRATPLLDMTETYVFPYALDITVQ